MTQLSPFHLAFPVDNLEAAREFWGDVMGCKEGRSSKDWCDFDFYGHQIVAHQAPSIVAKAGHGTNPVDGDEVPVPHFGIVLDMDEWKALAERLGDRKLELILEPGRSIAANAGILVTRVEFLKCTEHRNFAIIDAAMNDLIRPALYSAWQAIIPVKPHQDGEEKAWDLVGPVCETGDFLGKDRHLRLQAGDLLAVRSAGAYGFVMSSNYNTRNRPPELMVDGDQVHVVRRRETLEDQLAPESCLPE